MQPTADDFSTVRQHAVAINAAERIITDQTLRRGRHLSLARRRLSADAFDRWLATLAILPTAAALLERAAELFGSDGNADQLSAGAMLYLAGPDVPAAAIAQARYLARSGRVVSYATARELVERYTPPPASNG